MPTIETILNQREATHGNYPDTAHTIQSLKYYLRNHPGWDRLNSAQQEALEMIANKIGRVLEGDPNFNDHWDDISGYSNLVSKMLTAGSAMEQQLQISKPQEPHLAERRR